LRCSTLILLGHIFQSRSYVSPNFDASELTGENELAKPIIFNIATIDDQEKVEQDLKIRSSILVNFIYSLIYLSDHNFDDAVIFIQKAIKISETSADSFAGQENLYLIAAHIETMQKKYDIADQMLDKAFEINPNYARAHIARGNIYYRQATQSEPYDDIFLERALSEYQSAYKVQDQPQGSNIPIKAHASLGNIYFLKAQDANNDPNLYLESIENYKFIVDQYMRTKDPSIQELAALSYFNMGIAYERIGDIQQAIQFYENALKITLDSKFKEIVKNQLSVSKQLLNSP
jgi:tetratricopeptide (TPR) repeat protein